MVSSLTGGLPVSLASQPSNQQYGAIRQDHSSGAVDLIGAVAPQIDVKVISGTSTGQRFTPLAKQAPNIIAK